MSCMKFQIISEKQVGEHFFIYDSFEDEHYNLDRDRIILLYFCQIDKI